MNSDLSILEEFGASLAPSQDQPPAEVRQRVMRGMQQSARRPRLLPRLNGVRLAWRLGVPAVATTAVAAALVLSQLSDIAGGHTGPPGRDTGIAAVPGPAGETATQGPPNATQVLQLAAQQVADTPTMNVRPDQFLFIDSVEVESKGMPGDIKVTKPMRTRTWLSVDGTRDGLVIQDAPGSRGAPTRTHLDGCKNGLQAETIDRPETTPKVPCTPDPAYRAGQIPTDADGLLAYVRAIARAQPEWVAVRVEADGTPHGFVEVSTDQRMFAGIADILFKNHLPAVQAAAFTAIGRIPGVQVVANATDAAGRAGVAVTRTEAGTREEMVFDPVNYRYLGQSLIAAKLDLAGVKVVDNPGKGKKAGDIRLRFSSPRRPGEVIYKFALLGVSIVDKSGQLR